MELRNKQVDLLQRVVSKIDPDDIALMHINELYALQALPDTADEVSEKQVDNLQTVMKSEG